MSVLRHESFTHILGVKCSRLPVPSRRRRLHGRSKRRSIVLSIVLLRGPDLATADLVEAPATSLSQAFFGATLDDGNLFLQICGAISDHFSCEHKDPGDQSWTPLADTATYQEGRWTCAPWPAGNVHAQYRLSLNGESHILDEKRALESGPPACLSLSRVCAEENGRCSCYGTVHYGRKFLSGRPGAGVTTTLVQLQTTRHHSKHLSGVVGCNPRDMYGDPMVGYHKHCYCVPDARIAVCANNEGERCSCTGTVYLGRKFASGQPGHGATTTLQQLQESPHNSKIVSGEISCSIKDMGVVDPMVGYYKYCYCVPDNSPGEHREAQERSLQRLKAKEISRIARLSTQAEPRRLAVFVVGVLDRFILDSTLQHVIKPVSNEGVRVDYFVRLSRTWNHVLYNHEDNVHWSTGPYTDLSTADFKATVLEQAVQHGATAVRVTLVEGGEEIDPVPDGIEWENRLWLYPPKTSAVGQNALRRYKAMETLWNDTIAEMGKDFYSHVLVCRDDTYWFGDIIMDSFPDTAVSYNTNCGIPMQNSVWEYVRMLGGRIAHKMMTIYSAFYHSRHRWLRVSDCVEVFLFFLSRAKGVQWKILDYWRLPQHVARYIPYERETGATMCLRHYFHVVGGCINNIKSGHEPGNCFMNPLLGGCGFPLHPIPGCLNLMKKQDQMAIRHVQRCEFMFGKRECVELRNELGWPCEAGRIRAPDEPPCYEEIELNALDVSSKSALRNELAG